MNQPPRPPAGCPDRQNISCAIDGEAPAEVVTHVADCPECTTIADGYRAVDGLTSKVLAPPEGLPEKVKGACRGVTPVVPEPIVGGFLFFHSSPVRYAAALAITCTLVGLLVAAVNRLNAPGSTTTVDVGTGVPPGDGVRDFTGPGNVVQPVQKVDVTGTSESPTGLVPKSRMGHGFDSLPRQVEHVWTVQDVRASRELIVDKLLPEGAKYVVREDNGALALTVSLLDRDVQKLVDAMQKNGMELVSPALPQPGAEELIRFLGVNVVYEAVLVKAQD